jgi:hypothetical protein
MLVLGLRKPLKDTAKPRPRSPALRRDPSEPLPVLSLRRNLSDFSTQYKRELIRARSHSLSLLTVSSNFTICINQLSPRVKKLK